MRKMKEIICGVIGVCGSFIASLFGGWSEALTTLIIFMTIDYATGLIVAGVFHKSKKSKRGSLNSDAAKKGLWKKGVSLLVVLVACRLDILVGTSYIRDAVVIALVLSECISILENIALCGVPIPKVLQKAIDMLQQEENNQVEETK